jgi:hypothetical protein
MPRIRRTHIARDPIAEAYPLPFAFLHCGSALGRSGDARISRRVQAPSLQGTEYSPRRRLSPQPAVQAPVVTCDRRRSPAVVAAGLAQSARPAPVRCAASAQIHELRQLLPFVGAGLDHGHAAHPPLGQAPSPRRGDASASLTLGKQGTWTAGAEPLLRPSRSLPAGLALTSATVFCSGLRSKAPCGGMARLCSQSGPEIVSTAMMAKTPDEPADDSGRQQMGPKRYSRRHRFGIAVAAGRAAGTRS